MSSSSSQVPYLLAWLCPATCPWSLRAAPPSARGLAGRPGLHTRLSHTARATAPRPRPVVRKEIPFGKAPEGSQQARVHGDHGVHHAPARPAGHHR